MNDTLYMSIENALNQKDAAQFEIYCAIADQLLKEFFVEQAHQQLYMEAATSGNAKNNDKPFNNKGRIPGINKICDWFVRFITKLQAMVLRHHTTKTIQKIIKMRLYKENDDAGNGSYEYQLIYIDYDWFTQENGLLESWLKLKDIWKKYIMKNPQDIIKTITKKNVDFPKVVKETYNFKDHAKDLWDEIKGLSAVNNTVHLKKIKHSELDLLLKQYKKDAEDIEKTIKDTYSKKDDVVSIFKQIEKTNTVPLDMLKKVSEQYVKFITDFCRSLLYIFQINVNLVDRIWNSLGRVQHSSLKNDENNI
jgi:hypothetical protein